MERTTYKKREDDVRVLIEGKGGHGAIKMNWLHRFFHRKMFRSKVAKGIAFDWSIGYDVRNTIGPISIKNQGMNDSCGGQAGSYFLEIQRRLQGVKEGNISAKSMYAPIAYTGGGTTVSALETQIGAHGGNLEATVPSNDHLGNPLNEIAMEDRSWETDALIEDSMKRAGYTPYDIGTNIDNVASAIQNYGAAIMEITGQNNGTWTFSNPKPPTNYNPNPKWHHFMCLIGAKMVAGQKYIIALQSMGTLWGEQGIQYFGEDYFATGVDDVFTLIYDTHLVPNSDNYSIWAALAVWFRIKLGFV